MQRVSFFKIQDTIEPQPLALLRGNGKNTACGKMSALACMNRCCSQRPLRVRDGGLIRRRNSHVQLPLLLLRYFLIILALQTKRFLNSARKTTHFSCRIIYSQGIRQRESLRAPDFRQKIHHCCKNVYIFLNRKR